MKHAFPIIVSLALLLTGTVGCSNSADFSDELKPTEAVTQTTVSEENYFEEPVTAVYYDTYDEFYTAFAEAHPDMPLYYLPQELGSTLELSSASLDTTNYEYHLYDAEKKYSFMLQVTFSQYDTVQERLDELEENTISVFSEETIVQDWNYVLQYYPDMGDYALYGLIPETNYYYALVIWNDDGNLDTKDELLALRDALEL